MPQKPIELLWEKFLVEGDDDTFQNIYKETQLLVYFAAYAMLEDHDMSREVSEHVFLRIKERDFFPYTSWAWQKIFKILIMEECSHLL